MTTLTANAAETPNAAQPVAGSRRALLLPAGFSLGLAAFALLPAVRANVTVLYTVLVTAGLLLGWCGLLALLVTRAGRTLSAELILRRPHWMQPMVQGTIYLYWGLHWPMLLQSVHLILMQLCFAYAFDQLMVWSHRDVYYLGFGPCPIILSTNLFLWFKPDWFYLQFVLVAVGFAAKEFFRWERDGKKVHIFNPSSFPLAVASLIFILFGGVDLTYGREIATAISAPDRMFELIFLVALPGQIFFGVATMTVPAVATAFGLSAVYDLATGSSYFYGPITTAAFIGMLLLFTDPSTAPRSELGRVIYGVFYGLSVFVLYGVLETLGASTIYDKLLLVPVLNLSVRAFDRLAAAPWLRNLDPARLLPRVQGRSRNVLTAGVWVVIFFSVRAAHGVGDLHPANRLPFWQQACAEGRRHGCERLETMESTYCEHGSGWACNELGVQRASRGRPGIAEADSRFRKACSLGFPAACMNARQLPAGLPPRSGPPRLDDYRVLLDPRRLGPAKNALELLQRACDQGWTQGCQALDQAVGKLDGRPAPAGEDAVKRAREACGNGDQAGCKELGMLFRRGQDVPRDERRALACELGVVEGCIAPIAPAEPISPR